MKNQLLLLSISLISIISFSCKKNLLEDTSVRGGGGSAGGTIVLQPPPTGFKRNNGNGTCGGSAQVRIMFSTNPTLAPQLINVYQPANGILGSALSGYSFDLGDTSHLSSNNGYISYCIHGTYVSPANSGNLPPANAIVLEFYYPQSNQYFLINNEGDPYFL